MVHRFLLSGVLPARSVCARPMRSKSELHTSSPRVKISRERERQQFGPDRCLVGELNKFLRIMTKSGLGLFGNILGRINTEMKGLGSDFPFSDISR